jgi:hypothetical protein
MRIVKRLEENTELSTIDRDSTHNLAEKNWKQNLAVAANLWFQ